ncbi:GEVED domain-containing protein [Leucobacter luti]|uniref:GEVED domain-containing protein n=1 Tax=Leucobacter luti TaxID=340320 RepID=UPI00105D4ECA|nr:GEVED domain-containing protein [Leucobacter luti]
MRTKFRSKRSFAKAIGVAIVVPIFALTAAAPAQAAIWDLPSAERAKQLDAKPYFYGSGPVNAASQYSNTQLYQINPNTGLREPVGEPYANGYDGLAYDPVRNVLYAFETSSSGKYTLLIINPETGLVFKKADLSEVWDVSWLRENYIVLGTYNPETQNYVIGSSSRDQGAISIDMSRVDVNPASGETNYGVISDTSISETPNRVGSGGQWDWAVNPKDGRTYYVDNGYVYLQGTSSVDGDWWQLSSNRVLNSDHYNKGVFFDIDGFMYIVSSREWQSARSEVYKYDLSQMVPPTAGTPERTDLQSLQRSKTITGELVSVISAPITDAAGYVVSSDFGDAPDAYATELNSDGPRSYVDARSVTLGTGVTAEADARRPLSADGTESTEHNGRGDTDDSLAAEPTVNETATSLAVSPTVKVGVAQPVTVSAWLDVNGDGVFDVSERKTQRLAASSGEQLVNFNWDFPDGLSASSAAAGADETYLRLRVYDQVVQDPRPLGNYEGFGEVEDYPVLIERNPISNVNASASAAADSNANGAAVAAAMADATSTASAAANADATAAAQAAANADASTSASADATGSAQGAAQAAGNADASSSSNASSASAANADASGAASSAATADSSTSSSSTSSANSTASADSTSSAAGNVNASASAAADSNANGAAVAAAMADATSTASAAANADATAAAQAAANADASTSASADATGSAQGAAQAAGNADASSSSNASSASAANADASGAASSAATADSSTSSSSTSSANSTASADSTSSANSTASADSTSSANSTASADSTSNASGNVNASASGTPNASSAASGTAQASNSSQASSSALSANGSANGEKPATSALASTGADSLPLLGAVLGALAAFALGLFLVAKRRRTQEVAE